MSPQPADTRYPTSPDDIAETSSSSRLNTIQANPYGNPTSLLQVYPILAHAPTAKAGSHFSPHTTVHPNPNTSAELYPQHTTHFRRIDHPSSHTDWETAEEAEQRVGELLMNGGAYYSHQYHRDSSSFSDTTTSFYSSPKESFPSNPSELGNPDQPQPMPYSLIPILSTSNYRDPLTPASVVTPSPMESVGPNDYFESYVNTTNRHLPTPSPTVDTPSHRRTNSDIHRAGSLTPSLARTMSTAALDNQGSSPDPLNMTWHGPSPTKKRKSLNNVNGNSIFAPPPVSSRGSSRDSTASSSVSPTKAIQSNGAPAKGRMAIEVQIPTYKKALIDPEPRHLTAHSPVPSGPSYVLPYGISRHAGTSSEVTPSSPVDDLDDEDDEMDWGETPVKLDRDGDWSMHDSKGFISPSPRKYGDPIRPGSGRTGERDTRSTLEKFQTFLEDIFEESDSFPAEPTLSDLENSKFFSGLMKIGNYPLLSSMTIERLTRYFVRLHGLRKRKGEGGGIVWDEESLSRIMRLLERVMREAEGVVCFPDDGGTLNGEISEKRKVKGKAKAKKGSNDEESELAASQRAQRNETRHVAIDAEAVTALDHRLEVIKTAAMAVECSMVILDCEGLSKQMYSEDFVTTCVSTLKEQLTRVIYPVVEGMANDRVSSSYLSHILDSEISSRKSKSTKSMVQFRNPVLSSIALSTLSSIPHLSSLISRHDMSLSEDIVIKAVYLAIGPFFTIEPSGKRGKKEGGGTGEAGVGIMKSLRMETLGCLRGAFAKYENQRTWIIEEILNSLVKVPEQSRTQTRFQLTDGSSIHTISALLLQLIQASTHGVVAKIRKLRSSIVDAEMATDLPVKTDTMDEEMQICSNAIESAVKSARDVTTFLLHKSGSAKANKSSHDADYKAVLETFINDLLTVLYKPEWPAAAIYLSVVSRLMISVLEDPKSGADASAARSISLDHLGEIAARLRTLHVQMANSRFVPSLDEAISQADNESAATVIEAQNDIHVFLSSSLLGDGVSSSAGEMSDLIWAQELQHAIRKSASIIAKLSEESGENARDTSQKLQTINQAFRNALRNVWVGQESIFGISDPNQREVAAQASIAISRGRSLQTAFEPIVNALLTSMDTPAVGIRSKALRGLGGIITVDSTLLGMSHIRQAIESRLEDQSPAVRDAAVELVGKYVVQSPALATEYYPQIALRASDSGLGVRKRVVKLLRGIFTTSDSRSVKVDICCKMIDLIQDHDDTVKEMAIKTLADLMFPLDGEFGHSSELLVEVLGDFNGNDTVLEAALHEIAGGSTNRSGQFGRTIETLIEKLDHGSGQTEFDALSHVRAIYLLSAGQPDVVDINKATVLLTYLRPPLNSDDQAKNELLLKIFRRCIPYMPRVASTFAQELTKLLMPMIGRPAGGFQALKETLGCFCAVITHLTKDYVKLIGILRSCEVKTRAWRSEYKAKGTLSAGSTQQSAMILYIIALIVEFCNLDHLALSDTTIDAELRKLTDRSISTYFFDLFLEFATMPMSQMAPTMCLGSLFRAYPMLILDEKAKRWADGVFAGQDEDNKARAFGVLYEFLVSESEKKIGTNEQVQDVNALIGNAVTLSESGFSTEIVQRNIKFIFEGVKSHHPATQSAALDVLGFTVTQGLYNPLECLPILIALQTCDSSIIADRAFALHSTLHSKHSTLINVQFLDFAKASYDYQRTLSSEVSGHRFGTALLSKWFSLINEKKKRADFLRALCKAFEWDVPDRQAPDIGFVLYIAENLATFDYRLQEEIAVVVQLLCAIISSCSELAGVLETGIVSGGNGGLDDLIDGKFMILGKDDKKAEKIPIERLVRGSIVVGLAILTKAHLVDLHSIPEDKCLKHEVGKRSVFGDKLANKKGPIALDLSRMPFVRGVATLREFQEQQTTFLQLLQEDGSLV